MKYIDEYRDKSLIAGVADQIKREAAGEYAFMEVCGGHTAAIHRFGIPSLLPGNIKLLSGPGCPVCVTGTGFIDRITGYAALDSVIIATFGDLIRVPGSYTSLEKMKGKGANIRIVLSALDALSIASRNPEKKVVFPAIGFETTAPGTAISIQQARRDKIKNFFVLAGHKVMPPAMEAIITGGVKLDGFICPGHVSAVSGSGIFDFIPAKYSLGCVVSGFEPLDLLQSVLMLVRQVNSKSPHVGIQYNRAVTHDGNLLAQRSMHDVFEPDDAHWRGLGIINKSGLGIKKDYSGFDIEKSVPLEITESRDDGHCICGSILRGLKSPPDCKLFRASCTPENPVGACMVSPEGACNAFFKYKTANEGIS